MPQHRVLCLVYHTPEGLDREEVSQKAPFLVLDYKFISTYLIIPPGAHGISGCTDVFVH